MARLPRFDQDINPILTGHPGDLGAVVYGAIHKKSQYTSHSHVSTDRPINNIILALHSFLSDQATRVTYIHHCIDNYEHALADVVANLARALAQITKTRCRGA